MTWTQPISSDWSHGPSLLLGNGLSPLHKLSQALASADLERIPKPGSALQHGLAQALARVGRRKPGGEQGDEDDEQDVAADADPDGGGVAGGLLGADDVGAGDAAGAVEGGDGGGGEGALPVAGDVVGVVGGQRGPVADVGAGGEEGADVADGDLPAEAEHGEAGDQAQAVEDDAGPAQHVAVAEHRRQQHGQHGVVVRRRGQQDRRVAAEAHPVLQDDGQEVGEAGGDEVEEEEHDGEAVDFEVAGVSEDFSPSEGFGLRVYISFDRVPRRGGWKRTLGVLTIPLNAKHRKLLLLVRKKPQALVRLVREIDHNEICRERDHNGDESLDEEHVAPARQPAFTVELVEAKVNDPARREDDDLAALHQREPRLLLAAQIPAGDQIAEPGIDTRRRHTQQNPSPLTARRAR
nr:hypothetical protein CFP56_22409 [Quercus suber]